MVHTHGVEGSNPPLAIETSTDVLQRFFSLFDRKFLEFPIKQKLRDGSHLAERKIMLRIPLGRERVLRTLFYLISGTEAEPVGWTSVESIVLCCYGQ